MLNFKILNGKSLFFSKKHAQKTPLKNKKKFHFEKKAQTLLRIKNNRASEPRKSTKQAKSFKKSKQS